MLIMTSIVRLGQSSVATLPIDEDAAERIVQCIQTLALSPDAPPDSIDTIFLKVCLLIAILQWSHRA
jgi:coatomer subunit beta